MDIKISQIMKSPDPTPWVESGLIDQLLCFIEVGRAHKYLKENE